MHAEATFSYSMWVDNLFNVAFLQLGDVYTG